MVRAKIRDCYVNVPQLCLLEIQLKDPKTFFGERIRIFVLFIFQYMVHPLLEMISLDLVGLYHMCQ